MRDGYDKKENKKNTKGYKETLGVESIFTIVISVNALMVNSYAQTYQTVTLNICSLLCVHHIIAKLF